MERLSSEDYVNVISILVAKIVERLRLGQLQPGPLNTALYGADDELVVDVAMDVSMDGACKILDYGPHVEPLRGQYPFNASVTDAAGNTLELTITPRRES